MEKVKHHNIYRSTNLGIKKKSSKEGSDFKSGIKLPEIQLLQGIKL